MNTYTLLISLFILIIISICLIVYLSINRNTNDGKEHFDKTNTLINIPLEKEEEDTDSLKFFQCSTLPISKTIKDIFNKHNITQTSNNNLASIYLPCGYTSIENEYDNIPSNIYYIAAVKGCDKIVSKSSLWSILKSKYGNNDACKLVPKTYCLDSVDDRLELLNQTNSEILIFKKNIQRQEGLKLVNKSDIDIKFINTYIKNDFVVAQHYIDNPLLINNHKTNLRVYLLIVIKNNIRYAYLYDNGFMYYANSHYKYSTNHDEGITTGYIDRSIYIKNPLTHHDLRNFLESKNINANILFKNIHVLVHDILDGIGSSLSAPKGKVNFQLFGLDIQPDSYLNVKLIEINKGPSLQSMDSKDSELKYRLQEDMYKIIGLIHDNKKNDFVLVWKK